jgi:hypothetical protein
MRTLKLAQQYYDFIPQTHIFIVAIDEEQVQNKPTNGLSPWSRVVLEKPTVAQPLKKISAFYGIRRFITVFKTARH